MISKKTVLECINALMFNGKTISNTEFFKGKGNADKMWAEAISVTAANLMRWAEDNCVSDTLFREITESCKTLSGYDFRFITTHLYDEAYKIAQERLEQANKPMYECVDYQEPKHGIPISPEINQKVVIPWWRRTMQYRAGTIEENMPTDEQIEWMARKLNLDPRNGDNLIVIKCFLNDHKFAKDNGKPLLTKITVENGKAVLSYAGGVAL